MRRRWLLVVVSLALSTAIAEVALRTLDRFPPPPVPPTPLRPELYRPDPGLGYTLWPSTHLTYHYPKSSARVISLVSNADGFRNSREFDEPDSRQRIWMLGDSFVFGDGVDAADRLTEVIERLEPQWRVENLGMPGWGLDLMVRAFERISRRVKPDLVVVAFYTDDFRRLDPYYAGQGYPIPKFELVGGKLEDRPYPSLPAWRQLRTVQAFEQIRFRLGRNRYDLNEALLNRLHGNRLGVPIAVVFLPGRGDTDEDKTRRRFLNDWCRKASVPYLDLSDVIHRVGNEAAFIPNDFHWNEHGHEVAGTAIHAFLRDSGALRAGR
jgi:GDSL-like Lipase/Acylhydrolase family